MKMNKIIFYITFLISLSVNAQTYLEGVMFCNGNISIENKIKKDFTLTLTCVPFNIANYMSVLFIDNSKDSLIEWCYNDSSKSYIIVSGSDTVYEYEIKATKNFTAADKNRYNFRLTEQKNYLTLLPLYYINENNKEYTRFQYPIDAAEIRGCKRGQFKLFIAPYLYDFTKNTGMIFYKYQYESPYYDIAIRAIERKSKYDHMQGHVEEKANALEKTFPSLAGKIILKGDPEFLYLNFFKNH
jgi:hypothetical protein